MSSSMVSGFGLCEGGEGEEVVDGGRCVSVIILFSVSLLIAFMSLLCRASSSSVGHEDGSGPRCDVFGMLVRRKDQARRISLRLARSDSGVGSGTVRGSIGLELVLT